MLNNGWQLVEKMAARLQGKGWGAGTVKNEVRAAVRLMEANTLNLCIDIGGNKGNYTAQILKYFPDARIFIFEPSKVNQEIIAKKIHHRNVFIKGAAVSRQKGKATLFSNRPGSGLASLSRRRLNHVNIDFSYEEEVETIRFEDFWEEQLQRAFINICKLDIEGHELDALEGFGAALHNIDVIQFEFGGCNIDTRTYFQDFWYFFKSHGYILYRITPFGISLVKKYKEIDEHFTTTNYLAKRIWR